MTSKFIFAMDHLDLTSIGWAGFSGIFCTVGFITMNEFTMVVGCFAGVSTIVYNFRRIYQSFKNKKNERDAD